MGFPKGKWSLLHIYNIVLVTSGNELDTVCMCTDSTDHLPQEESISPGYAFCRISKTGESSSINNREKTYHQ